MDTTMEDTMTTTTTTTTTNKKNNNNDKNDTTTQEVDPFKPNLLGSLITCPTLKAGPNAHSSTAGSPLVIQVQNMTATVDMGMRLNLKTIASKCHNTEYNPKKFGACVMRLRSPKCTMLLFHTGKCVITGARSSHNAALAARKFTYVLGKVGFKPGAVDFKVQNIIGTADVGFPIRLEGVVLKHAKFASYEPELFPGLIYRMLEPKTVLLIFVSGKVVITGARSEAYLARAMERIHPVLEEFRKNVMTQEEMEEEVRKEREGEKRIAGIIEGEMGRAQEEAGGGGGK
ncbi:hypothetical protein TrCOL_g5650 [Triparma columacea]|uniref:TATA-box-binding protein n=1 Tax=Triparma columacea TaxID=722753 RepID=A0A9W7GLQ3_9STRA|nr:hypothetical protein TrCOL_g5650 [Triparma columacea]